MVSSSSQKTLDDLFDETFDEAFDQMFNQYFDQTFEKLTINNDQEEQRKKRKKELISKEIVKKAMYVYGMIISVKLQRILKFFSDDVLE